MLEQLSGLIRMLALLVAAIGLLGWQRDPSVRGDQQPTGTDTAPSFPGAKAAEERDAGGGDGLQAALPPPARRLTQILLWNGSCTLYREKWRIPG